MTFLSIQSSSRTHTLFITFKFLKIAFFFILLQSVSNGQSIEPPKSRKLYLDFGGSIGLFIPFDQVKEQKTLIGSNAMTALQLNYKQNYFLKLQFGQTIVNYKSANNFDGLTSTIDAKANSTNLGLSLGYQHDWGSWQPFILAGAGASFIDVPKTAFNQATQTVNYITSSGTYLHTNIGVGINYKVSSSFIFYMETQASTLPQLPDKSKTHLSSLSTMMGIKAPL